ncbi:hypothetical protein JW933_00240 [candidate division FCPU426 bacterium]|nr:hypothetical protein [candidate division FCPU426 bacterium]
MQTLPAAPELTEEEFADISQLVKKECGINLTEGKKELVKARLARRLKELGLRSYGAYYEYLRNGDRTDEMILMMDVLSTHVTQFFRQPEQFHYLRQVYLVQKLGAAGAGMIKLRVWSAGCASGEEAYSLAVLLCESLPLGRTWDVRILATDLSTRMLAQARAGTYTAEDVKDIPPAWLKKYFRWDKSRGAAGYCVSEQVKKMVSFARLNLMEASWPMRGPFDLIFCRNVMIYFESDIRQQLINRFWSLLAGNGLLAVGQAEGFSGIKNDFKYLGYSLYGKK